MSGIFPRAADGGLAPNPADPLNPTHAFPPPIPPVGTSALYYGNGCDVRLRPEVLNSIISELAALCDSGQVAYDPSRLTNVELAVRYLIQRGLPIGALLTGGLDNNYSGVLVPP